MTSSVMRGNRGTRRMMDKMGVDMNELNNVQEVIIKTDKKELVIQKPTVTEMQHQGATTFMVLAEDYSERELEVPTFSDDEINLVCQEAGVDKDVAVDALAEADGDIARAILTLAEQS